MSRGSLRIKGNAIRALLISISGVALFFSLAGFAREYRFAVTLRSSEAELVSAIMAVDAQYLPWGAHDLRELMTRCAALQLESELIRVVPRYRAEVARSCQAITSAVLADSPTHGRAQATALVTAGPAMTAADYARAQAAAPFEPWPLGTRLQAIGHAFDDVVPADLLPLIAADADRAMGEHWGRLILATLYIDHPALRPLLTEVAKGRPASEQRAFLDATRREATND